MTVTPSTLLSDIALEDTASIPLLMRFGLLPGYGRMKVGDALAAHDIDTTLFMSVVHAFFGTPESWVSKGDQARPDLAQTIRFLEATDRYHTTQLRNIGRHLGPLLKSSGGEGEGGEGLRALSEFFGRVAGKFEERFAFDAEELFPSLPDAPASTAEKAGRLDRGVEEELADLLSFFVVHLGPGMEPNLLTAVITSLSVLHKDVVRTNRVRRRLLGCIPAEGGDESETGASQLTAREKEVLALLARGLSNKEVADRLCISAHTAITHRRNISSKLGIRSLAGLSVYALLNGLLPESLPVP